MRFPRKRYPAYDKPSADYSLGFSDAESHYAQVVAFAEAYISLLERQVSALQKQLAERDGHIRRTVYEEDRKGN